MAFNWNLNRAMRFALVGCICQAFIAGAAKASDVESEWLEFQRDPRSFMDAQPMKLDKSGAPVSGWIASPFSRRDIESREYVEKKAHSRPFKKPKGTSHRFQGEVGVRAKLLSFLDSKELKAKNVQPVFRLAEMEEKKVMGARLDEEPWSGSYWPIYQGMLGARYASEDFYAAGSTWKAYSESVLGENTLAKVLERGDAVEMDTLSPSEKYDLILGDPRRFPGADRGFLTPHMWIEGQRYDQEYGEVESWMGLCHGWAPASFMDPRPSKAISTPSAVKDGSVRFYPSDLKGLSTLAWAKSEGPTSFLGGRCSSKSPKIDPQTGRILEPDCFDVNPGIWHLVVVNQLGLVRRSFVIDATYDYEVWNQPVFQYSYSYFNPQTGKPAKTLTEARVAKGEFSKDKFAKYRDTKAASIVGIEMKISYTVETQADQADVDSPESDATMTASYLYDLELDQNGEIIGGEWYTNRHPDFLWLPGFESRPYLMGDYYIPANQRWNAVDPLPKFWRDIGLMSATKFGQPVGAIVEALMRVAR